MTEPAIKVVLFDVGNVIIRATHEITHAILRDYGVPYATAIRFYANDDYPEFSRGRLTATEFGERARARMNGALSVPQIYCAHNAHLYDEDEGVVVILDALQSRGVPLAFATDTNQWQTDRERELIDLRTYGRAFRSNELGALKADGGAFAHIVAEIDVHPSHILFVDDSPEKIERAAALGMVTHRFTSATTLRQELARLDLLD